MVLSLVVMGLVDGNCGVDDGWLDGFLLNNRLNGFMDVVVVMFAADDGLGSRSVLGLALSAVVFELGGFLFNASFDAASIAVVVLSVLNGHGIVVVCLW